MHSIILIIMSFAEYCCNNVSLALKQTIPESVALLTLLNADTLFLLKTNNAYEVYRVRSN